jgi:hypothetical protein
MEEKGLDPSAFIIAKNAPQYPVPYFTPGMSSNHYDYTIFFAGRYFTVSYSSDLSFLEYFYQLCLAPDEPGKPKTGILFRIEKWLKGKPDFLE